MKAFSYICNLDEVKEVREKLIGMGANVFKQVSLIDLESPGAPFSLIRIVFTLDKETETVFRLAFPPGTISDCSA
jgi:hypothetical protein